MFVVYCTLFDKRGYKSMRGIFVYLNYLTLDKLLNK